MKRLLALALLAAGCDAPTRGEVLNQFDDDTVVYRVWFQTTLFPDPLEPGGRSQQQRLTPTTDYAHALLAPGWDITSGVAPTRVIPVRSTDEATVDRGAVITLSLSADNVLGDCARGKPLTQDEADLITQRIFPGPFAQAAYDAKSCTVTPLFPDAGH